MTEKEQKEKNVQDVLANFQLEPELVTKVAESAARFRGQVPTLEQALGAVIVGKLYGWRVLRILHPSNSWNKFERILGIKFKDWCPETTLISERNVGYKIAKAMNKYWDVVTGREKVPEKQVME